MKNKVKKIILIVIILISIVGIVLTIYHAKENISNSFNIETTAPIPNQNIQEFNHLNQNVAKLTNGYIALIGLFCTIISLIFIYLMMSIKNQKFYKNRDKLIVYILSNIVLVSSMLGIITFVTNNVFLKNSNTSQTEKEEVTLDESNKITENAIDLDKQSKDVTITSGGSYTLSGSFAHSVIVDAEGEDVNIILDDVEIKTENTASIIGFNANKITITLNKDTTNTLSDSGNSTYDGCIFSNAELVFEGTGELIVNGNQNEGEGIATETQNITFNGGKYKITSNDDGINAGGDGATITFNDGIFYIDASGDGIDSNKNVIINGGTIFVVGSDAGGDSGIDTDEGYTINGGSVVALGSDMIETPLNSSKQKTIAFTLDSIISKDTIVTLMKDDEVIVSFRSNKNFKTLIISNEYLTDGSYTLYTGGTNTGKLNYGIYQNGTYTKGEKITINNSEVFSIDKTVNIYGMKGND